MSTEQILDEIPIPDISHLVIEDDTPVDNFQSAKQQRLLVEPLYSSTILPTPFIADANVGIFASITAEAIVPDVFVSLGVEMPADWSQKQNRSYLVWQFGKFPDVVIEIVSNRKGNELIARDAGKLCKKDAYARMGIPYYVVFDPLKQIQGENEMNGALLRVYGLSQGRYFELDQPFYLETIGLGLTLWEGEFEGKSDLWLRWCFPAASMEENYSTQVIPTGAEDRDRERLRAEQERLRAEQERLRADRLADRLRQMGIDPEEV